LCLPRPLKENRKGWDGDEICKAEKNEKNKSPDTLDVNDPKGIGDSLNGPKPIKRRETDLARNTFFPGETKGKTGGMGGERGTGQIVQPLSVPNLMATAATSFEKKEWDPF